MILPAPAQLAKQKELNLFGKPVENTHLVTIADALKTNTTLKFVGFRECRNITDAGAVAIAKSLVFNGTVKMLNFESTGVGDKGVIALADAIPNSGLTRIELGYLRITDAAARALAAAIKLSTTLTTVTLDHCKGITEEGGRALAKALESNVTMTHLGLKGTAVGAPIRNAVEALLAPAGLVKRQCGTADSILSQMTSAPALVPAKALVKGLKGIKSLKPDVPGPSGFGSSGGSVGSGSARLALAKGGKVAEVTPRKGSGHLSSRAEAKGPSSPRSSRSRPQVEAAALAPAEAKDVIVSSPLVAAEAKAARKNLLLLKGKMAERSKRASLGSSGPEGLAGSGRVPVASPETVS